jgi:hypothetical protein
MDLEREAHALGVEDVDDRPPALGEVLVAALDLRPVVRRERVEHVPHRRPGEARDDLHAELRRGRGGVLHPLGGAGAHALGIAVAPHLGRQHALVARVDGSQTACRPGGCRSPTPTARAARGAPSGCGRSPLRERPVDLEVVAPARELEAVVAPGRALRGDVLELEVGPLPGEQRDRSGHAHLPPRCAAATARLYPGSGAAGGESIIAAAVPGQEQDGGQEHHRRAGQDVQRRGERARRVAQRAEDHGVSAADV